MLRVQFIHRRFDERDVRGGARARAFGGGGLDAEVARVAQVVCDGDGERRFGRGGRLVKSLAEVRERVGELFTQSLYLFLQTAQAVAYVRLYVGAQALLQVNAGHVYCLLCGRVCIRGAESRHRETGF
jgi:hypothetical protein